MTPPRQTPASHARRIARLVLVLAIAGRVLTGGAAAQELSLRATAGLSGQARPGRWTPVLVEVTSPRLVSGSLVVTWGDARVTRDLVVSAGVPKAFELYVRTDDPRDVMDVRLESDGRTIASVQAPLRVVPNDFDRPPLLLCGDAAAALPRGSGPPCDLTLEPPAFPRSWRGWSGADALLMSPGDLAPLDGEQRRAVDLAAEQARLRLAGLGSPVLGQVPSARRFPAQASAGLTGCLLLTAAGLAVAQWRRSAALACLVLAGGGCAGAAAVYASGRIGSGAAVVVHHAATLDQYEGAEGAILTLRGFVEFPSFDVYQLRANLDDGAFVAANGGGDVLYADAAGLPTLVGRHTLGSTVPIGFDGSSQPVLRVERRATAVHVINASAFPLTDCAFAGSFAGASVPSLPPGAVAIATSHVADDSVDDDPTFACTLADGLQTFSEPHHPVVMAGTTRVVLHLDPGPRDAAAGSDR